MQGKKRIRRLNSFQPNELDAMRAYFEEMAAKGWFLVKITGAIQTFERGEPEKLRYAVELFDKATGYDTRPEGAALDYIGLCEEAGWRFCGCSGRVYVFCSADGGALPIETDLEQKYRIIRKDLLRQWMNEEPIPVLLLAALECYIYFEGYEFFYSSPTNLFLLLLLAFLLLAGIGSLAGCLRWCAVAKRRLQMEGILELCGLGGQRRSGWKRFGMVIGLLLVIFFFGLFCYLDGEIRAAVSLWAAIAAGAGTSAALLWVSSKGFSRDCNQTFSWGIAIFVSVLSFLLISIFPGSGHGKQKEYLPAEQVDVSQFPIALEDTGGAAPSYRWSQIDRERTFLAEYAYYRDFARQKPDDSVSDVLAYSVYSSGYPWLLERYMQYRLKEADPDRLERLPAEEYGALEAYRFGNGLLLRYPDKAVWFWPLSRNSEELARERIKAAFSVDAVVSAL